MKTRVLLLITAVLITAALFSACSQKSPGMQDGYYTAEAADFNASGWKEYIAIYVSGNKILTVEYDAYNASGFVRSWDVNYMRIMNKASGTYPNEFTRAYAISLLNWQDPARVDAVSGATNSCYSFQLLADAVIAQSKAGDKQVALVDLPEIED